MKRNLSIAVYGLTAMGLLMGSCVSKRKYMEMQTSAAERYRVDSTQWTDRSNTMQQNIASLEQKSIASQKQMDSLRTTSINYQKKWDNVQSTYTSQTTATEQLHQQIHTAIDQYVEANNVEAKNGKVYVNLPESMLFTSGSSSLSAKGKQALDKLAGVLASNENVEVDVMSSAAYYNNGNMSSNETSTSSEAVNMNGTSNTVSKNKKISDSMVNAMNAAIPDNKNAQASGNANIGDSSFSVSGSVTNRNTQQESNKTSQAKKSRTLQKNNSTGANKSRQGDQAINFKSTPKISKSKTTTNKTPNWNLNVARSTAVVRQLTQSGLPQARILLTGQKAKPISTNEWSASNRGYQIVISPKMDYYQMMQSGQGSTSMK